VVYRVTNQRDDIIGALRCIECRREKRLLEKGNETLNQYQDDERRAHRHISNHQLHGFLKHDDRFKEMAYHPRLLSFVSSVLNINSPDTPEVFQDMILAKPPGQLIIVSQYHLLVSVD